MNRFQWRESNYFLVPVFICPGLHICRFLTLCTLISQCATGAQPHQVPDSDQSGARWGFLNQHHPRTLHSCFVKWITKESHCRLYILHVFIVVILVLFIFCFTLGTFNTSCTQLLGCIREWKLRFGRFDVWWNSKPLEISWMWGSLTYRSRSSD